MVPGILQTALRLRNGNLGLFQYVDFETSLLKNENLFLKNWSTTF